MWFMSYVMYSYIYIYVYVCMSSEVTGLILDVCVSVCCYFGACGLSLCLSVRGRSPVPAVLIISGCCSWLSSAGTEVWSSAPHTHTEREREDCTSHRYEHTKDISFIMTQWSNSHILHNINKLNCVNIYIVNFNATNKITFKNILPVHFQFFISIWNNQW